MSLILESCSDGVIEDGGADVGDEDVELSGDEIGDEDGHDGDAGRPIGYDSDSIKLRSSEWCDDRNDIVSLSESGDGGDLRRSGGGEMEIARIILGTSGRMTGVDLSDARPRERADRGVDIVADMAFSACDGRTAIADLDLADTAADLVDSADLADEMTLLPPTDMSLWGTGGGWSGNILSRSSASKSSRVPLMSWMLSAISLFSAPLASLMSFRYCRRRLTSCVRMWLGASDAIVSMLDAMDGVSPRGVDMLSRIDAEGVNRDGEGEGGRGTNSGKACTETEISNPFSDSGR